MTVKEIIKYLELCNPEFPVVFEDVPIECVEEHRDIVDPDHSRVILM